MIVPVLFLFFVGESQSQTTTVEGYILEKCGRPQDDDTPEFVDCIGGGGWSGWHCEGSPLHALFALLLWDELFRDIPEVFQTPYQDSPLDLGYPSFVRKR